MSRPLMVLLGSLMTLTACAQVPAPVADGAAMQPSPGAADAASARVDAPASNVSASTVAAVPLPKALVHKSASCGCCGLWVKHLEAAGFEVAVNNIDNLEPIKQRLGVPLGKGSCHTAEIDGLVFEGHVPAEDIKRLLANRSDARGLVVPGMPMGSPGMEVPSGQTQPYVVEQINADGTTSPFATHGEQVAAQ